MDETVDKMVDVTLDMVLVRGIVQPYRAHGRHNESKYKVKTEIPNFYSSLDIEAFLDWMHEAENFF